MNEVEIEVKASKGEGWALQSVWRRVKGDRRDIQTGREILVGDNTLRAVISHYWRFRFRAREEAHKWETNEHKTLTE